jgi:hypothetical protein
MSSEKLQVKFYLASGSLELEQLIPVFHRWIRERLLDEIAIDVADYSHMHRGPGVVLVGHAADYYFDQHDGRDGLMFSRKRAASDTARGLSDGFRRALVACRLLEEETSLASPLRFSAGEALVRVPDRLHAPNTDASFAELEQELCAFGRKLYGADSVAVERIDAPGALLSARLRALTPPDGLASLLARLS